MFAVKRKSKQLRRLAHSKPTHTAAQYFAKPPRQRASLVKTAHVVTAMRRDGLSLKEAAREVGIRPETVQRYAGSALRKTKSGKYEARASDTLLRPIVVVAPGGLREIVVRDSASATLAAEHSNAVQTFLQTGDETELQPFRGQSHHRRRQETGTAAYRSGRARTARGRGRPVLRVALCEGRLMAARPGKDPMKTVARRSRSQRRVGDDAGCACGEKRPEALIPGQ